MITTHKERKAKLPPPKNVKRAVAAALLAAISAAALTGMAGPAHAAGKAPAAAGSQGRLVPTAAGSQGRLVPAAAGSQGRLVPAAAGYRGRLVSATPLRTLPDKAAVAAELTADGFSAASVRYGVRSYRLVYQTVSATGLPTTASGLLVLPIGGPRRLSVVSFTHGTEVYRGDAPSRQPRGFEPDPAYTYASAGFAAAAPDYLGMGTGPGTHPWMDVPSETTATLDMLRAARSYITDHGRVLRRQVLATGFSQGASAALGLGRALQDGASRWFRLGALAPVSGAYDLRGVELPAILSGELVRLNPRPKVGAKYSVLYAAYGMVAFDRLHPFYRTPAAVFKPPYDGTIFRLLNSYHPAQQVLAGTPGTLPQLLTARGFALLRHPAGGLATELRIDDSVCDWAPAAPIRLYMATRDEQAVNANTWHCQAGFADRHLRVPVVNLGTPSYQGSRHLGSNVAGTARIVRWFLRLTR